LAAFPQGLALFPVVGFGAANDPAGSAPAQQACVLSPGTADHGAELESTVGFDNEGIATAAVERFAGDKAAELAAFAVGNQVFGCRLQDEAQDFVDRDSWIVNRSIR
jgi:hypothetical protein